MSNFLFKFFAASQVMRASERIQRGLSGSLHRTLDRSVSSAHGAPTVNHFSDSVAFACSLDEARDLFDDFAAMSLNDWRRERAGGRPTADGYSLTALFHARQTFTVQLTPRTIAARAFEGLDACNNTRASFGRERVEYRYHTRLVLAAEPDRVVISYETREQIDPQRQCRRDLTQSYSAPSMPYDFGRVGEQFLAECSAHFRRAI
jgi:hypothetical protein